MTTLDQKYSDKQVDLENVLPYCRMCYMIRKRAVGSDGKKGSSQLRKKRQQSNNALQLSGLRQGNNEVGVLWSIILLHKLMDLLHK